MLPLTQSMKGRATATGLPFELRGVQSTKRNVKRLFWETGFDGQKYPLSWLVEKFWPVPGWTPEQLQGFKCNES